jgi:uncharacterized protein YciI
MRQILGIRGETGNSQSAPVRSYVLYFERLASWARKARVSGAGPVRANGQQQQYCLCLMEKGEKWTPVQFADPAMQEHLAQIPEQVEAGKYVVVGPALAEGRIGGRAITNAASIEEARKIADADKMVQSGRRTPEIHPVMLADLSALHIEYPAKVQK